VWFNVPTNTLQVISETFQSITCTGTVNPTGTTKRQNTQITLNNTGHKVALFICTIDTLKT